MSGRGGRYGELASRASALFDRLKEFPEGSRCEHGTHLKRDAFTAFLDLRQLMEKEIIPELEKLEHDTVEIPMVDLSQPVRRDD